jgi:hypothetical protein
MAAMVPRFLRTFLQRSAAWALAESKIELLRAAIRPAVQALTATSTALLPSSAISMLTGIRNAQSSRSATGMPTR